MDQAALVFLVDDQHAQRLAVSWPRAYAAWVEDGKRGGDAITKHWCRVSGLYDALVKRIGPTLLDNEICTQDGATDAMALTYIRSQVAKSLPKAKAEKKL